VPATSTDNCCTPHNPLNLYVVLSCRHHRWFLTSRVATCILYILVDKTKTSYINFPPVLHSFRQTCTVSVAHCHTHSTSFLLWKQLRGHVRPPTSLSPFTTVGVSEFQQNLLHLSEIGKRIFCSPKRPDRIWGPDSLLHSEYRTPCFHRSSGRSVKVTNCRRPMARKQRSRVIMVLSWRRQGQLILNFYPLVIETWFSSHCSNWATLLYQFNYCLLALYVCRTSPTQKQWNSWWDRRAHTPPHPPSWPQLSNEYKLKLNNGRWPGVGGREEGGQEVKWFPENNYCLSFCFVLSNVCGGCH